MKINVPTKTKLAKIQESLHQYKDLNSTKINKLSVHLPMQFTASRNITHNKNKKEQNTK